MTGTAVDTPDDVGGALEVLDPTGHFEVRWGKSQADIEHAEAMFNDLLKKGYLAFRKTWLFGAKGKSAEAFDPQARVYIFEKPEAKALGDEKAKDGQALKKSGEKDGPIQVEATREDTEKREAFEAAKKVRDETFEQLKAARAAVEEASNKHREALRSRDESMSERRSADASEREAVRRLGEATTALEAAHRERDEAAKALEVDGLDEAAKSDATRRLEASKTVCDYSVELRDKASAAVDAAKEVTKKVYEETADKVTAAQAALDEAATALEASRKRRSDAEKTYDVASSACNDAERAFKGEPSYEQTRKFDKKADTTMTPPMRGG